MGENIKPTLGNVLFIGLTASVFAVGGLLAIHTLAGHNVPLVSPAARGLSDLVTVATTSGKAA